MSSQTQMTNPPKAQVKMYKLVALQDFQIGEVETRDGRVIKDTTRIVKAGEVIEVSKDQARDLTRPIAGYYAFSGERFVADGDCKRHELRRARLATEADLVQKKAITPIEEDEFKD